MWSLVNAFLLTASNYAVADAGLTRLPFTPLLLYARPVVAQAMPPAIAADEVVQKAVREHLFRLKQAGYAEMQQGLWLQTNDGESLAGNQAERALPAASLTKIATTLAGVSTWSPNHEFVTTIATTGRMQGDTLQGDLIVQGGGDPLFVWEEAIALANTLNRMGLRRVQGNLVVVGAFAMNFEEDPKIFTTMLRQAFNAPAWTPEIVTQYQTLPPGTPQPSLQISGTVRYQARLSSAVTMTWVPLVRHRSLPLWQLLKRMNTFSNNVMAEMLAKSLGGAKAVERQAILAAAIAPDEIHLINGSGLGEQNRISPRAVVAMLIAIQNLVQLQGLSLADLFPGAQCRCGTIADRTLPAGAIVKTGTLDAVSALAGVIPTRDRGAVWFAAINYGAGNINLFHAAQERLLQAIAQPEKSKGKLPVAPLPNFTPVAWQDGDRNEILQLR